MANSYLEPYINLVDFLADFLGTNAEVVLHDLTDLEHSIVKIRNGHISGRKKGDPSTDFAMRTLKEAKPGAHYKCNYRGITKDGRKLKSSTYYIRSRDNEITGMLCVNMDVDQYINARKYLDSFFMLGDNIDENKSSKGKEDVHESFGKSIPELIENSLIKAINNHDCEVDRLSAVEKSKIIEQVNNEGIFLLKGAVSKAAQMLNISEPTVYRYLGKIKSS